MQVKLVGVQYVNFTNNNGETINGTNIFCAFKDWFYMRREYIT